MSSVRRGPRASVGFGEEGRGESRRNYKIIKRELRNARIR